jgi:hypothetical protein
LGLERANKLVYTYTNLRFLSQGGTLAGKPVTLLEACDCAPEADASPDVAQCSSEPVKPDTDEDDDASTGKV